MTREEAIRIMQEIINNPLFDEKNKESFKMAIKALEQEPCEDATPKDIFCIGCDYKEQEHCTHWKNGKCNGNTEPCNDAISREAVKEIINDIREQIRAEIEELQGDTVEVADFQGNRYTYESIYKADVLAIIDKYIN